MVALSSGRISRWPLPCHHGDASYATRQYFLVEGVQ
jgi:hypothetical protein